MSIRMPSTTPSGEKGSPPSERPYPWRLFVGMLLAIVVGGAILAVLLGLNPLTFQRMGSGAEPTPIASGPGVIAAATPAARATPLIISTSAPAVGPTAAPTPATGVAPQPVRTPAAISTSPATSVPAPAAATVGAEPTSPAAAATIVPTDEVQPTPVQPAITPELASAIIQGYDSYWSVRVQASGDPEDASWDLGGVMAEGELQAAYKTLNQYRQEGIAFRTTVNHQIWITDATATEATVVDRYSGQSVRLNLQSKQPDGSDPVTESFTDVFFLKNIDGVWKVVSQQPWQSQ
jgi:hypothetical protein